MRVEYVSRTHVGLRRKINEDALLARPDLGLWVVADGMGGHEAGEVASGMIVDALARLPAADTAERLAEGAISALDRVNGELIALAQVGPQPKTIGSTVVGLAAAGSAYTCFWAGDSRAYRVRDGCITQITRDHSLVQGLVDAGMLSAAEAESHPEANVITRAVGAASSLKVDTVRGDIGPGDLFLLASDGLTKIVAEQEIAEFLSAGSLEDSATRLLDTVLDRGAPDNVSLIIVRPAGH
jgi:serine/threonine protein phosphatase PrpC